MTLKKMIAAFMAACTILTGCNAAEKPSATETQTETTVEEKADPAPVESGINIYIEGDKFMLEGKEVWLTGMNAPWQNWNDFGGRYNPEYWQQVFAMMHEDGFNSCRIWINCSSECAVQVDESG